MHGRLLSLVAAREKWMNCTSRSSPTDRARRCAPHALAIAGAGRVRAELQGRLSPGEITIEAFSRAWRVLEGPLGPTRTVPPDEQRLRDARQSLTQFKTLWRDTAVPDKLREEAVAEIIERHDVRGREIVGVHPRPSENAWLLGQAMVRSGSLGHEPEVGMVGARGVEASLSN